MDKVTLRKVQLTQLEILREIRRVCEENDIHYFLADGTFLGAVRHQGFIPWDDDLDVGMMRADYDRFCKIAPEKLGSGYCFQNWHTDPNYALPFGKVRKRNTVYLEGKASPLKENGIYVDVFIYDNAPADAAQREALRKKTLNLFRTKLMKSHYTPWMENGKIIWKKRIGYLFYQLAALFTTQERLIERFEETVRRVPEGDTVYGQYATPRQFCYPRSTVENLGMYSFEGDTFPGPGDYDEFLTRLYGDYMTPPPVDQRENRHQIVKLDFGPEEDQKGD